MDNPDVLSRCIFSLQSCHDKEMIRLYIKTIFFPDCVNNGNYLIQAMANLRVVALLALLSAAASATEQEAKIPETYDGFHHGYQNTNFPVEDKRNGLGETYHGTNNPNFPVKSVEGRKFFKPYFYHPFYHNPYYPHYPAQNPESEGTAVDNHESQELTKIPESESISINDDETKPVEALPYEGQDNAESEQTQVDTISVKVTDTEESVAEKDNENTVQVKDDEETEGSVDEPTAESRVESRKSLAVACDFLTVPRFTCYTCYTYLECKQSGGKVKSCSDPHAPYCVNGLCSTTPSEECALNSTASF